MKHVLLFTIALFIYSFAFTQANTKLSNLVAPTTINASLIPITTNTSDLGTSTLAWKNIYLRGDLYMDGGRFLSNHPGGGAYNVFVGANSGRAVTRGNNNTSLGHNSLLKDTSGSYNTAIGSHALYNNTNGNFNTAIGLNVLYSNTIGTHNTATGPFTLYYNTTGIGISAYGYNALANNTTGNDNTAQGANALTSNKTGIHNTAYGSNALYSNISGKENTATGFQALYNNATDGNTANGYLALHKNTHGIVNTAIGRLALYNNLDGDNNTSIGQAALLNNTTGSFNTAIGSFTDVRYPDLQYATAIGFNAIVDASNKVRIGSSSVTKIGGQVGWTTFSDGKYKQNIKQDVQGLNFINSLNPITYTVDIKGLNTYYNKGRKATAEGMDAQALQEDLKTETAASKIIYSGFVAQDVEEAAKKLGYEFSGVDKPESKDGLYGLRYADFVVPLVKAVQELSKENEELKKKDEDLRKEVAELRQMMLELKNGNTNTINSISGTLEQNSPNPFTSSTAIRYYVPQSATSARLTFTNAKGQLVKTISLSNRGTGQLNLEGGMLAAGAYNYTLWVDGKQADTKKLLLTK
jgi:hypothetical protein